MKSSVTSSQVQAAEMTKYLISKGIFFYKYYYCLVIIMKMNALDRLSCDIYQPISTFVLKTYSILAIPQNAQIIAWNSEGNSFTIKDTKLFVSKVLPYYFRHKKYESFIRQLNMYKFSKLKNQGKPCFSNQFFRRDKEQLLKFIHRKPQKKKKVQGDLSSQRFQKMEKPKEVDQLSDPSHINITMIALQTEILKIQNQVIPQISRVNKKFTFKEQAQSMQEQNFSTLMKPSSKWISKDQSCWQQIKSYKSFKISMKLLEEGQESVRPEKCELNEPLDHERVSFSLLEPPPTLKNIIE